MRLGWHNAGAALVLCLMAMSMTTTHCHELDSENEPSNTDVSEKEKRLWGSKSSTTDSQSLSNADSATMVMEQPVAQQDDHGIPFVFRTSGGSSSHQNKNNIHYEPPQGFQITSRVYTDPTDKLAHFDNDSAMVFPYWECGVPGSTTVPIPLQHATVRHLLGGSQPNLFSGTEFGPYPQIVVALSSLDIVLNSGQVQTFQPGDVILLEDVVSGGHKLKGHDNQDMTVMILTLTEHYHQVGKDKTSLQSILTQDKRWRFSPCPNGLEFSRVDLDSHGIGNQVGNMLRKLQPRSIRRYLLTVVGLSLSTVLGDFMGKVAPLWLAVVFGGGCFVTGGTLAFVKVGDMALDELEMWQERRLLRLQSPDTQREPADQTLQATTVDGEIEQPGPQTSEQSYANPSN